MNEMVLDPNVGDPSLSPASSKARRGTSTENKAAGAPAAPAPTALVGDGGSDDDDPASGAAVVDGAGAARRRPSPARATTTTTTTPRATSCCRAGPAVGGFLVLAHHAPRRGDDQTATLTRCGVCCGIRRPHSPNEAAAMALQRVFGVEKPRAADMGRSPGAARALADGLRPPLKPDEKAVVSFVRRVGDAVAASKAPPPRRRRRRRRLPRRLRKAGGRRGGQKAAGSRMKRRRVEACRTAKR